MRALLLIAISGCASATPTEQRGLPADAPHADPDPDAGEAADAGDLHDAHVAIDAPAQVTCATPASGVIATWSFAAENGSQASTPVASASTGVVAGAIARSAGLTAVSGSSSINSSGWPTGALDTSRYYTLTITPPAGCTLDLTSVAIDAKASGTGPSAGAVATSADTFAQSAAITTTAPATATLGVTGQTHAIELRVYGFMASSAMGTFRLQNTLALSGSIR